MDFSEGVGGGGGRQGLYMCMTVITHREFQIFEKHRNIL